MCLLPVMAQHSENAVRKVQRPVSSTLDSDVELRFGDNDTDSWRQGADSSITYTAAGEKITKYEYDSNDWIVTVFQWDNNAWVETDSYPARVTGGTIPHILQGNDGWKLVFPIGRIMGLMMSLGKPEEQEIETVYDSGQNLTHVYLKDNSYTEVFELIYNTYGPDDNKRDYPVLVKNYGIYHSDNNRIVNYSERRYKYTARGYLALYESYWWDYRKNTWVTQNDFDTGKEANTYNATGRLLSTETYSADQAGTGWIPSTRIVRERNEQGWETRQNEYVWFENRWAIVEYTIHYYPGDVSNETVTGAAVWSYGSNLYVRTPQPAALYVYTIAGTLYRQQTLPAGETTLPLPQGMYLVQTGKTVKKVLIR
jgi:hypothetical protein